MSDTNCTRCDIKFALNEHGFPTGYGIYKGVTGDEFFYCYHCCGELDVQYMKSSGETVLYLTYNSACHNPQFTRSGTNLTPSDYKVCNFANSLTFTPTKVSVSKHNMAGQRWDVWFNFDGSVWHGYQVGNNTQILRCKRTKQKAV